MTQFSICYVDDQEDQVDTVRDNCNEVCRGLGLQMDFNHLKSIKVLQAHLSVPRRVDLLIVDLKLGSGIQDRSGWEAVRAILGYEIVPVLVYSAFAAEEGPDPDVSNAFIVSVVRGVGELGATLKKLVALKSSLNRERERIVLEFGRVTLASVGKIMGDSPVAVLDDSVLVSLARSRLISLLMNSPPDGSRLFPPESIFVFPPLEVSSSGQYTLLAGDFLEQTSNGLSQALWLVVSPSCDLVQRTGRQPKSRDVLLVSCFRSFSEMKASLQIADRPNDVGLRQSLHDRLRAGSISVLKTHESLFSTGTILLDFKSYQTKPLAELTSGLRLGTWKRLASLATPYGESVRAQFLAEFSRIATPDTPSSSDESNWLDTFLSR